MLYTTELKKKIGRIVKREALQIVFKVIQEAVTLQKKFTGLFSSKQYLKTCKLLC